MKKTMKRALSLLLTLAMILSLGVLPASAAGIDEGEEIDAAAYPAQQFSYYEPGGLNIDVKAPAGALPRGTTMEVSRLANLAPVQDAVDRAEDLDGAVVLAADISFWHEGEEVEPAEGNKILVTMTAPEIAEVLDPVVVHVPDEQPAVAERVDPLPNDDEENLMMGDQISFEAEKFSVYAVIGNNNEDEARVAVEFYNNHLSGDKLVATYYVKNGDVLLGNGEREVGKSYIEDIVTDPGIGEVFTGRDHLLFIGWSIDAANANTAVEGQNYDTEHYGANYTINTRAYDIDEVREYLSKLEITEGMQPVKIYAMVVRIYVVTYLDSDNVSLGSEDVLMGLNESSAPYTITMGYTPLSQDEHFEGWNLIDGTVANEKAENEDGELVDVQAPYPVGTTMTISSDVTFSVNAPKGHWLVFEEVLKGATYNAPVFIYEGNAAITMKPEKAEPANMKCTGYTFAGWYEAETDENGVPLTDANKNVILKDEEFDWNTVITKRTVLYAKWDVASTATYTVIVWKQSVVDDKNAADAAKTYDFGLSAQLTSTPGTEVADLVSTDLAAYLNKDGGSITVGDKQCSLFGFKQNTTQVPKKDDKGNDIGVNIGNGVLANSEKIAANGTTVINIYYDRELVTYDFQVYEYGIGYEVDNWWGDYGLVNGVYVSLSSSWGEYYYLTYNDGTPVPVGTTVYYRSGNRWYSTTSPYYDNTYYAEQNTNSQLSWNRYTGDRYSQTEDYQWVTKQTMTGLYGQKLTKYGYQWPTDHTWYTGPNTNSFSSIVEMFTQSLNENPTSRFYMIWYGKDAMSGATIYHYLQNVDESWPASATHTVPTQIGNGMTFRDFAGFKPKEFRVKLPSGVTQYRIVTAINSGTYTYGDTKTSTNGWTDWLDDSVSVEIKNGNTTYHTNYIYQKPVAAAGGIEFRYERETYKLNFMVGMFVNGNMEEQPTNAVAGLPRTVTDIAYEASLASYAKGGADYFDPFTNEANAQLAEQYVFDGWYVDDACTQKFDFANATMPLDGVTVYGKWIQKQYRVFLHPNATLPEGSNDPDLDWGSDSQELNFRISYGGTLSAPNPRRDASGYEFIGWYTDPECKHAFNLETKMTDDTVDTPYDKTEPTDPLDKFGEVESGKTGYNSDATGYNGGDRFWITTKLDLYGKWGATLSGAKGIMIVYDANGGSEPPEDSRFYKDNVDAIAQAATIPANAEKDQFLYWVMQKWVGDAATGHYEDIPGSKVYPGDTFTVLKSNAKVVIIKSHTDGDKTIIDEATYTLQLRAEYGPKDVPADTYIKFHANNGKTGANEEVENHTGLQINEAITVPTPATFHNGEVTKDMRAVPTPTGLTNNGKAFIGWAKLDVDSNGTLTDTRTPENLTEADLWLKWVEAGDGETAGHYLYKDASGNWTTTVTQVAADESRPYQDLYAVWADAFYVYHSGDNTVQRVLMTKSFTSFDLTQLVDTSKYLYGGYYKDYAGKSATFSVDNLSWKQADSVNAAGGIVLTASKASDLEGCKKYDLENISSITWDTAKVYSKANGDAPGNAITPVSGTVYYLKEVPATNYLSPKLKFTYRAADGEIATSWLVTDMDDTNYLYTGFQINDTDYAIASTDADHFGLASIEFIAKTTGNKSYITPTSFGVNKASLSFLKVYNNPAGGVEGEVNLIHDGDLIRQFWVTPDGMRVTGTAYRSYTNITVANGYTNGIKASKFTEMSAITVYTAG